MNLPDFLKLSEEEAEREQQRQQRLKQEFNSRARQAPVEMEMARALLIEDSLREALQFDEKKRVKNQLAENMAQQGRFIEASRTASDKGLREFYRNIAKGIFRKRECKCSGKVETVEGVRIALPKYRVIKEVYSIPKQQFGYLVECNTCQRWFFITNSPLPPPIKDFDIETTPNDLQRLRI